MYCLISLSSSIDILMSYICTQQPIETEKFSMLYLQDKAPRPLPVGSLPLADLSRQTVETQAQGVFPPCETLWCPRKKSTTVCLTCNLGSGWVPSRLISPCSSGGSPRLSVLHTQRRVREMLRGWAWAPLHRRNLKFKEDASSPAWVQMRIQSIT